jgi:hypothetical protein
MEVVECVFRLGNSDAAAVSVLGPFNNWSTTATPMQKVAGGKWEARVELPPGQHPYCYFMLQELRGVGGFRFGLRTGILLSGSVVSVPSGSAVTNPEN